MQGCGHVDTVEDSDIGPNEGRPKRNVSMGYRLSAAFQRREMFCDAHFERQQEVQLLHRSSNSLRLESPR